MYARIGINGDVTFEAGRETVTLSRKDAIALAESVYDTLLSEEIRALLADRGIKAPPYEEDKERRIAFDQYETSIAMECPTLRELVSREAERAVDKHHPLKEDGRR